MLITKYPNFFKHLVTAFDLKMVFTFCFQHRNPCGAFYQLILKKSIWNENHVSMATNMCNNTNLGPKTFFLHSKYGRFSPNMEFSKVAYCILHQKVV